MAPSHARCGLLWQVACFVFLTGAAGASGTYDVRAFGARGDGTTKDTAAIQRALDACAKTGGRVIVPSGTYLTGSLYLGDDTELHLAEDATILGSPDLDDYNAPDAYPQNWGSRNEGWSAKHLILALERRNVSITGKGTIDGNGRAFFDDKPGFIGRVCWRDGGLNARGPRAEQRRPGQEIVFIECRGVTVRDVTFRDMSCWSCFFHGCEDVTVGGVMVRNGLRNLNTDGFDIDSCRNVRVGDYDITTGDDAIAIRGSSSRLKDPSKVCENVRVSNIVCRVSADGVRVGVGNGTIRNVRVSDMVIECAGRGLHVQCCYVRAKGKAEVKGVDISDVTFERIKVRNAAEAVLVGAGYPGSRAKLEGIRFDHIDAESFAPSIIAGNGATRARDVGFSNCSFRIVRAPGKIPDDSESGVLVCDRNGAFRIQQADNISFRGCTLIWSDDVAAELNRAFALHDAAMPSVDGRSFLNDRQPSSRDGWRPEVRLALDRLIDRNRGNPDAYAVFDFDYTTAIGDLSYSCLWRLLETMDIRAGENISELLSAGVPGEHVAEAAGIAEEMMRMKSVRCENLQETAAWGRFAARYWKFYRTLFREQGSAFACEWRNRIFAGYSPAELRPLAHDAVVRDLAKGGLSRDRNAPSEFRGLAFPREIKALFRRLRAAGIKVYIVSATMRDFLLAATGPDFGLDFDPDCVFGSNLKLGEDGRYLAAFNETGVKSGSKANFIRKTIARRHHGAEPVRAAGDSMGDYDMLTGFPALQVALVFDRRPTEPLIVQLIASAPSSGGKVLVQARDEVRGVLIPDGETVKP